MTKKCIKCSKKHSGKMSNIFASLLCNFQFVCVCVFSSFLLYHLKSKYSFFFFFHQFARFPQSLKQFEFKFHDQGLLRERCVFAGSIFHPWKLNSSPMNISLLLLCTPLTTTLFFSSMYWVLTFLKFKNKISKCSTPITKKKKKNHYSLVSITRKSKVKLSALYYTYSVFILYVLYMWKRNFNTLTNLLRPFGQKFESRK